MKVRGSNRQAGCWQPNAFALPASRYVGYSTVASGRAMTNETKHISVCVCTYKRPQFLQRLLKELGGQDTQGLFTFSIVVADNDHLQSAKAVVLDFVAASSIPITYCVEPRQNIALARNKAIENATGDFVAFIDDDEFPAKYWLLNLFKACEEYDVDGVLGPVKRHFEVEPPKWVIKGRFYERPTYPTGLVIDSKKGRTGNTLLRKRIFTPGAPAFRPEFLTGEDQDFFRRMIDERNVFIWCNEAVAYEVIPAVRWQRRFMLRRALLRGATTLVHPTFGVLDIAKSIIAVPLYAAALPFALLSGHHRFMTLLIKVFDHLGKLLALLGIRPVEEQYVTG
ncbi:MAG: glycosyltransferase family 2 protein [Acidobacteria bacterium]|nr:MAG: glycosyltransferase family 2 protein [Acidobacteriota bacterium]